MSMFAQLTSFNILFIAHLSSLRHFKFNNINTHVYITSNDSFHVRTYRNTVANINAGSEVWSNTIFSIKCHPQYYLFAHCEHLTCWINSWWNSNFQKQIKKTYIYIQKCWRNNKNEGIILQSFRLEISTLNLMNFSQLRKKS